MSASDKQTYFTLYWRRDVKSPCRCCVWLRRHWGQAAASWRWHFLKSLLLDPQISLWLSQACHPKCSRKSRNFACFWFLHLPFYVHFGLKWSPLYLRGNPPPAGEKIDFEASCSSFLNWSSEDPKKNLVEAFQFDCSWFCLHFLRTKWNPLSCQTMLLFKEKKSLPFNGIH